MDWLLNACSLLSNNRDHRDDMGKPGDCPENPTITASAYQPGLLYGAGCCLNARAEACTRAMQAAALRLRARC